MTAEERSESQTCGGEGTEKVVSGRPGEWSCGRRAPSRWPTAAELCVRQRPKVTFGWGSWEAWDAMGDFVRTGPGEQSWQDPAGCQGTEDHADCRG